MTENSKATLRSAHSHGIPIAYDDRGTGEPAILFMPGWCASRAAFDPVLPEAAAHRRAVALEWRGHGESGKAPEDFGEKDLVEDALAVIEDAGLSSVVPVALAQSGWVAIELRRRLGASRVPGLVFMDWLVADPPPAFGIALRGLQDPARWEQIRDQLFYLWLDGVDDPAVHRLVRGDMGGHGFEMWARSGREIAAGYAREGTPLQALARLEPAAPILHLYSQPDEPRFLAVQQEFAAGNPWFRVVKLDATSHFPMFEMPDRVGTEIERFLQEV